MFSGRHFSGRLSLGSTPVPALVDRVGHHDSHCVIYAGGFRDGPPRSRPIAAVPSAAIMRGGPICALAGVSPTSGFHSPPRDGSSALNAALPFSLEKVRSSYYLMMRYSYFLMSNKGIFQFNYTECNLFIYYKAFSFFSYQFLIVSLINPISTTV